MANRTSVSVADLEARLAAEEAARERAALHTVLEAEEEGCPLACCPRCRADGKRSVAGGRTAMAVRQQAREEAMNAAAEQAMAMLAAADAARDREAPSRLNRWKLTTEQQRWS
jgi:hypothetical protein